MKLIYSVEDNPKIREIITMTVESADMEIQCFNDVISMLDAAQRQKPDLILLDIMLPGIDGEGGLKILKSRTQFSNIPVIMLSAKDSEYDKVKFLNLGASDYIAKPFGVLELIARIKANLKYQKEVIREIDEWSINLEEKKIFKHGEDLKLSDKEYRLLKLLIENRGKVLKKSVILDTIWGEYYQVENRTLNMVVLRLRTKVGDGAIETIRGVGFKMVSLDDMLFKTK